MGYGNTDNEGATTIIKRFLIGESQEAMEQVIGYGHEDMFSIMEVK